MIGERLKRARTAAGLSMRGLAEQVGVSANMIKKYEHDESMPSSPVLIKLAKALKVRSEYFFRPANVALSAVEYRKRSSTPKKLLHQVNADVLDQAERWYELKNLWPNFPLPAFSVPNNLPKHISELAEIEDVAKQLREAWQLGLDAIPKLVDLLESRGILVITTTVKTQNKIDGLQASIEGTPVIVVTQEATGDRQRFTLAHELGHLILQNRLSPALDEEKACNHFAGAFLLPDSTAKNILGEQRHMLEMQELYLLKHEYGLSMAACLYRAKQLNIISEEGYTRIMQVFSQNGWRTQEPGAPYKNEQTTLFQQLVYRALGEGIIGDAKAAELLKMTAYEFHQDRKMEVTHAVADQRCEYSY